jgi:hypothetical protein
VWAASIRMDTVKISHGKAQKRKGKILKRIYEPLHSGMRVLSPAATKNISLRTDRYGAPWLPSGDGYRRGSSPLKNRSRLAR